MFLKNTLVQIAESKVNGDLILAASDSKQLKKSYGWKYNLGNEPSAYLTGYLCGLRAKKSQY